MAFEFERVVAALLVLVATGLSVVLVRTLGLEALRQTTPGREHILASALQLALVAMGVGSAVWLLNVNAAIVLTLVAILSAGISLALDRSAQDVIAGVKLALSGYVREGQYVVIGD
ncbi:MAG: mechanosensitive ion channel, partial [Caldilineaceae bacterium]|nr:mechanosensitive ion channel [Caldilineaceae bacterium]